MVIGAAALVLVGIVGAIVWGVQELLEKRRERRR
jgi:ABC-type transport system involved in cytochrome c biogenesis permease subunit